MFFHVFEVETRLLIGGVETPKTIDLGKACDTRFDQEASSVEFTVPLNSRGRFWPRPHKTHLSVQDVDELREVAQAVSIQELAKGSRNRLFARVGMNRLCRDMETINLKGSAKMADDGFLG